MCSFRPPLRKRTVENDESVLTDELCCSEEHGSEQNSQEVLSCGFLPPKQRKASTFRPPLRDLVSPAQNYINRILHEEQVDVNGIKEGMTWSSVAASFELAPLNNARNQENINDHPTLNTAAKKHQYYYHIGKRKIEQPVVHKKPIEATGKKPTVPAISSDNNESRFKVFEFQLSQVTEKKTKCEATKREKSLSQV